MPSRIPGFSANCRRTSWTIPSAARPTAFIVIAQKTNAKYEGSYCQSLQADAARSHCALALALQPALDRLGLGYDMLRGNERAFGCIGPRLGAAGCSSRSADAAVLNALRGLHGGLLVSNASSSGGLGARLLCDQGEASGPAE